MNLRERAEADNEFLLEDNVNGFGHPATFTAPDGTAYKVIGKAGRIGVDIDPETGLLVQGNKSSFTARLSRFPANQYPDVGWTIETTDITGATVKGKVLQSMLDRTLGRVTVLVRK